MFMKLNPESETIEMLAKSILVAARTAPKAKGKDDIVTALLETNDVEVLASAMEEMAEKKGEGFAFFKRDAQNVRNADAVILIGFKTEGVVGLNCGACGFESCKDMLEQSKVNVDFTGPNCSFKYIDMGIALGSAAAKAKDLCVDNRVMYSVGAGALAAGLLDADIACGMPLSIKGKNLFFDRK
ncbi:Ferredoxin domain containing protein [Methanococcoides methylutens MM1]|uniref:Ferredoxin domain containing protein n=2 Tax=Methanococcoides methylutens TaxID=2226 RepID=A0A0E3SR84_METMT|nr:Ferredoxin domain containing protein [Methanococcoides methylutens MM1]